MESIPGVTSNTNNHRAKKSKEKHAATPGRSNHSTPADFPR
jgi:hypothetical protein